MESKTSRLTGFTLIEIMIVVAIIGLLAAIAIPNFLRARSVSQQNACINNLRQIDGAIQEWALQNGAGPDDSVTPSDIQPYLGRGPGGQLPWCPLAGSNHAFTHSYSITSVANPPACNLGGVGTVPYQEGYQHVLPQ